jgi:hypothetical protein
MWLIPPSLRSAFAPESGCLTKESDLRSAISALPCEQWPMLNGKPLQPASLLRSWKQERWSQRLCGAAIFDASAQDAFAARWISSLPDSPARTCRSPGAGLGWTASAAVCSSTSSTLPTIAVRGGSLWRTSQASLLPPPPLWTKPKGLLTKERPPESWENWPTAGGMRNGSLFQRPTWALATGAKDGSASHGGWATPDCNTSTYSNGRMGPNIRERASQWMTPHGMGTTDHTGKLGSGGEFAKQATQWSTPKASELDRGTCEAEANRRSPALQQQAVDWPTPRATDGTKGGPNQAGSKGDLMLPSAAAQWPTPASRDYRSPNSESLEARGGGMKGEQLPNFIEHHFLPQAQQTQSGPGSSVPVVSVHGSELSPTTRPEHVLGRLRLNPAFGCWLMGWPSWWTNPGITSSVKSEMESYRSRQRAHLSFLLGEQDSSEWRKAA